MAGISLKVNGQVHTVDVDPETPLLYVLSDDLRTPKMCAEPVLRAGEELTLLKFLRCVNSTADAARHGSSPTERVQVSTHSPAVRWQRMLLRLGD